MGVFRDFDMDVKTAGEEKKAVFVCLADSDQDFEEYEELEDDFVFTANDNKPALELQGEDSDFEDVDSQEDNDD